MKGIDILNKYLTDDELERYMLNLTGVVDEEELHLLLHVREWYGDGIMWVSFHWVKTPEGHAYWNNISLRMKHNIPIDKMTPHKHIKKLKL